MAYEELKRQYAQDEKEYKRDEDAFKPQEFQPEYFSGLNWREAEKYVGKMMEFSDSGNKWVTATLSKIITERDEVFRYVSKVEFRATYCRTCPETFADPHPTIRITVNGKDFDLPKPETEEPSKYTKYWVFDPAMEDYTPATQWEDWKSDHQLLQQHCIHLTEDRAQAWADFWQEIHK
jgi:hypothetical protein